MLVLTIIAGMLVWSCAGWDVQARDLFVDQNHPEARDDNPGTEAKPFRTIQPAVDAAKSGDTIYVKAGVYSDVIQLRGYGRARHPNRMLAWKEDRVVVGSVLRDLPAADRWQPIQGRPSYQVSMPAGTPEDLIVILDGRPIVTQYRGTPPDDDKLNWATYRRSDRVLVVNTGDGNPAAVHKAQFARRVEPFRVTEEAGYWVIKGLEFAWCNTGISMDGTGILLEDCYFHDIYRPAVFCTGRMGVIRRCNFWRCGAGVSGQQGLASIIEDCLFVGCGLEAHEDIDSRVNNDGETSQPISFKGGPVVGGIIRYNIIADSKGCIWHDCGGTGLRIIGNAFWSNAWGTGIYNEYGVNDTLVIGNYFYRTAMSSSWSARMTVADNFFDNVKGGGVHWCNRDPWPLRHSFMTLRGNAFTGVHRGYLGGENRGQDGLWPEAFGQAFVDYNRVRVLPDDYVLIHGTSTQMKTLGEIQKEYGWELHSEVKTFDAASNDLTPESMGGSTVTFRVPWGPRSHLARPMLADAAIDGRWPAAPEYVGGREPAFFWRVADGDCDEKPLNNRYPDLTSQRLWHPESSAGYDLGVNRGASWYVGGEDRYLAPGMTIDKPPNRAEWTVGNRWLAVVGVKPEEMPLAGVGWWTPWLATAAGARINVSLKIQGKDLQPTDNATPAVYLQFINETGRKMTRNFLVGQEAHGKMTRSELVHGSYGWTEVKETITAPETAVRMALFLGLQPCRGEIGFDGINIKTEDGAKPASEVEITEATPPRIAKERMREIIFVDLGQAANRALADDQAGDGRGGWTDQGPELDMRRLPTGTQSYGGVPFRLLSGDKAVVVLRGNGKAGTDLPQEATFRTGGRKMEALYILHANTLMDDTRQPLFSVTVAYQDGTKSEFQAWPHILADWLAEPVRSFPEDWGTTAARTVPVGTNARGTVYRTEWILDRAKHGVPVQSITVRGTSKGVPIILGLTGATQW